MQRLDKTRPGCLYNKVVVGVVDEILNHKQTQQDHKPNIQTGNLSVGSGPS